MASLSLGCGEDVVAVLPRAAWTSVVDFILRSLMLR
jgi:hypothetical protein